MISSVFSTEPSSVHTSETEEAISARPAQRMGSGGRLLGNLLAASGEFHGRQRGGSWPPTGRISVLAQIPCKGAAGPAKPTLPNLSRRIEIVRSVPFALNSCQSQDLTSAD